MTDPASPAAVTEERIEVIRRIARQSTRAVTIEAMATLDQCVDDLLDAYDARGLELARAQAEQTCKDAEAAGFAKWSADSIKELQARLAQANEARLPNIGLMLEVAWPPGVSIKQMAPTLCNLATHHRITRVGGQLNGVWVYAHPDETPDKVISRWNEAMKSDAYPEPWYGWTCFQCGETFRKPGEARKHFGTDKAKPPACTPPAQSAGDISAARLAEIESWLLDDPDFYINCTEREATDAIRELLGTVRAQASALAEARRSALEEAAKIVKGIDIMGRYVMWPQWSEIGNRSRESELVGLTEALAKAIRALTELQHGNG